MLHESLDCYIYTSFLFFFFFCYNLTLSGTSFLIKLSPRNIWLNFEVTVIVFQWTEYNFFYCLLDWSETYNLWVFPPYLFWEYHWYRMPEGIMHSVFCGFGFFQGCVINSTNCGIERWKCNPLGFVLSSNSTSNAANQHIRSVFRQLIWGY